jgi:hypothetical protein
MAQQYTATTEGEIASGTAVKTLVSVFATADCKPLVYEWGVSFQGVSATAEPVLVRLVRLTANDGTSTAGTPKPAKADAPATIPVTCRKNYTAEPTKGDELFAEFIHPQGGIVMQYPLGREKEIDSATTAGIGVEVTAAASVDARAHIDVEV